MPLRILLAEDNIINCAVAAGILEKMGHSLVHAANGLEVLSAIEHSAFDMIFMDVQMPEMDGFQATRRIREMEAATGGHIPIVAMTAHAMAGDRERCLDSGMDDYIAKPLNNEEVQRALVHCSDSSPGRTPVPAAEPPQPPEQPLSLYTREELLDECDGDGVLMEKLIELFQQNTPRLLDEMRDAIARHGSADLARAAHALLSSLGAFGAHDAHHLTQMLEAQANHEDYEDTRSTFAALERRTGEIYAALAAFTAARA